MAKVKYSQELIVNIKNNLWRDSELDLSGSYLNVSQIRQLCRALADNKYIKSLYLVNCGIDNIGASCLANNTTLTLLSVRNNQISSNGAHYLSRNNFLTTLDISYNFIGIEGLVAFLENNHLTSLNLNCKSCHGNTQCSGNEHCEFDFLFLTALKSKIATNHLYAADEITSLIIADFYNKAEAETKDAITHLIPNIKEYAEIPVKNAEEVWIDLWINRVKHYQDKTKETYCPIIFKIIELCNTQTALIALQKHLATADFNFLRARTGTFSFTTWQGSNEKKEVVPTSKTWATIEKAIALRIMCCQKNISNIVESQVCANNLASKLPFFHIPRYRWSSLAHNTSFYAFAGRNDEKIKEKTTEIMTLMRQHLNAKKQELKRREQINKEKQKDAQIRPEVRRGIEYAREHRNRERTQNMKHNKIGW